MANISGPVAKPRAGTGQWWIIAITGGSGGPLSSSVEVVQGTRAQITAKYGSAATGPYPTKAAAEQAAGQAVSSGSLSNNPSAASPAAGFISQATGLFAIGHWIGTLVTNLINLNMYKALGWFVVGGALTAMGLVLWFRQTDFGQELSSAATTAAMAA